MNHTYKYLSYKFISKWRIHRSLSSYLSEDILTIIYKIRFAFRILRQHDFALTYCNMVAGWGSCHPWPTVANFFSHPWLFLTLKDTSCAHMWSLQSIAAQISLPPLWCSSLWRTRPPHADPISGFRAILPGNRGDLWTRNWVQKGWALCGLSLGPTDPFLCMGLKPDKGRAGPAEIIQPRPGPLLPISLWY